MELDLCKSIHSVLIAAADSSPSVTFWKQNFVKTLFPEWSWECGTL